MKVKFNKILLLFEKFKDFTKLANALILLLSIVKLLELLISNGETTLVDLAMKLLYEIFKSLELSTKTMSNTPFPWMWIVLLTKLDTFTEFITIPLAVLFPSKITLLLLIVRLFEWLSKIPWISLFSPVTYKSFDTILILFDEFIEIPKTSFILEVNIILICSKVTSFTSFKTIAFLSVFLKFNNLIEVPLAPDTKYKVTLDNILTDPPFNIVIFWLITMSLLESFVITKTIDLILSNLKYPFSLK